MRFPCLPLAIFLFCLTAADGGALAETDAERTARLAAESKAFDRDTRPVEKTGCKEYWSSDDRRSLERVIKACTRALQRSNWTATQRGYAFHVRGSVSAVADKLPEALADLNQAATLIPNYAPVYYERGYVHMRLDQPALSHADFQKSVDLGNESAEDPLKIARDVCPSLVWEGKTCVASGQPRPATVAATVAEREWVCGMGAPMPPECKAQRVGPEGLWYHCKLGIDPGTHCKPTSSTTPRDSPAPLPTALALDDPARLSGAGGPSLSSPTAASTSAIPTQPVKEEKPSWFSWLWGSKTPAPQPTTPVPNVAAASPPAVSTSGGAEDQLAIETSKGKLLVKLRPDLAPKHVERVRKLAREGFYNGIKFHRVITGFMAQTGDPTGTGKGGSKYPDLPAEFSPEPFRRGTVAAARTAAPDSANSQFFICFTDTSCASLTGQYTVWGHVIEGMDTIDHLAAGEPPRVPDIVRNVSLQSGTQSAIAVAPPPAPSKLSEPSTTPVLAVAKTKVTYAGKDIVLETPSGACFVATDSELLTLFFAKIGRPSSNQRWRILAGYQDCELADFRALIGTYAVLEDLKYDDPRREAAARDLPYTLCQSFGARTDLSIDKLDDTVTAKLADAARSANADPQNFRMDHIVVGMNGPLCTTVSIWAMSSKGAYMMFTLSFAMKSRLIVMSASSSYTGPEGAKAAYIKALEMIRRMSVANYEP